MTTGPPPSRFARINVFIQEQLFLLLLAAAAAACVATGRVALRRVPEIIDSDLLLVLFALLISIELLRESKLLDRLVVAVVRRTKSARTLALGLVALSGLLAMVVTNDVALFIVIPFTVIAARYSNFRIENAVLLQIIATNLLGCLTPLGNPQNLFILHRSSWTVGQFIVTMLPLVAAAAGLFMLAVWVLEPRQSITVTLEARDSVNRVRAIAGTATLIVVVFEIFRLIPAWVPAAVAAIAAILLLRDEIGKMDLSILPIFFCAFILVDALGTMRFYDEAARTAVTSPVRLYVASIGLSQLLSNVPTTVLLSPMSGGQWTALLYGVNVGGCGTIIASLANLLGWRIYVRERGPAPGFVTRLTIVSSLFGLVIGLIGWWLID